MYKYLLSLMVLLPLSTFVVSQEAEEAENSEVEEVVTTGIRSSLIDAISIKRENVGVVDAITAEDIGKFADRNIAEALSRLVGVTTNRDNGESTSVTIRGLGPEFNLVTLNGRSMPTVPPLWVGGRSFDFGDIIIRQLCICHVNWITVSDVTRSYIIEPFLTIKDSFLS